MLRELITTVYKEILLRRVYFSRNLAVSSTHLFSSAATLYFIYTELLATYFICLFKLRASSGIEPPCLPMTSSGNGTRLVGWIHLKTDLFGAPAFISLLLFTIRSGVAADGALVVISS
jgi:hypothetical protein